MPVSKVSYVDIKVSNRAGTAAQVLGAMAEAGVNLLAFTGFPDKGGRSQLDLVTKEVGRARAVARKNGWKASATKKGFLIQGQDEVGAVHRHLRKLASQRVNITAVDAVVAGKRRFGAILWVKSKDYARAARALGAR
jgi:hypothetical protein